MKVKVDERGRITIPKAMRRKLVIERTVDLRVEEGRIVIYPVSKSRKQTTLIESSKEV
ncbi:hypothetical protein HS1genome_2039 [Sulfodiicoccus acidiphilus]|uniref:SpoVT-AbrB domain-containing protein n=1 Tax=Sulfodiicoccus acidiphilus TaxID=1670455 RepID=A0A348B648_9CREN|nr:AbrB/MazE/SpoVT family DNA-binding domain-containing protein [Sulfodiicoccus acidiphilus]BBD73650.1 hypothetical protein HS1genome_2039 [Sulfodiicoccus acidiphilus]GGU02050.1 hypothetical protein GCM10007116_18960 [Sulfodiicoccus acidiphilus]